MRRIAATLGLLGVIGLFLVGQGASDSPSGYQVRAIFDNGSFLVSGEDVRVAGANVGSVDSVDVSRPGEAVHADGSDDPGKAVVVLNVTDPAFEDFRADASCIIRPQSLLGEKYVDCQPTQPHAPGTVAPAPLEKIPSGQAGAGERLLPLEQNGKEVDLDLVNNIMREPYADRFRLILNDLGAGLAARGSELEDIVRRADPALRETDLVLGELARENRQLAQLASDSDQILAPLAREREHVAGFINNANTSAEATAAQSQALESGFQKFPEALRQLRLEMAKFQEFSNQAQPFFADFSAGAPAITRATKALGPFAHAATPALTSLGDAAAKSQKPIVKSDPILKKTRDFATTAAPGAKSLAKLLASLRTSGGYQDLTKFLYNTTGGINGFDQYGHFLRAVLRITNCTQIVAFPVLGCGANWGQGGAAPAKLDLKALKKQAEAQKKQQPGVGAKQPTAAPEANGGAPRDALGDLPGGAAAEPGPASGDRRHAPSIAATRDLYDAVVGQSATAGSGGGR